MQVCRLSLIVPAVFVLLAVGCAKPDTIEQFIKAKDLVGGVYSFDLALDDSLGTYDISFYTRIDSPSVSWKSLCLKMDVTWRSPSGIAASETVYMDAALLREKYRSGISPDECGKWRIDVRVSDPPEGFCGLGIICQHNGTR